MKRSIRQEAPICRICDKFWEEFLAYSEAWEKAAAHEDQLVAAESEEAEAIIQRAAGIEDADQASAFRLYLEAAEAGSAWASARVGWHYWTGTAVAADPELALGYYYRAIGGGSWMAFIHFARILAQLDRHDDCDRTLEEGVACGFVPAYFWLGWLRYQREKTAKVRREVRPLLAHAARHGHPYAQLVLGRWMMLGKLGLRDVPRGVRLTTQGAWRFCRAVNAGKGA
ncbi:MAG: tetratricopeptide repeat protein [Allosphingosinicella sp.]